MRVALVTRDVVGLARTPARYRVRAWGPPAAPGYARTVDEWDLLEATDAREVFAWVDDVLPDRQVEIYAVVDGVAEIPYVRISGEDGDADSGTTDYVEFRRG